MTDNSAIPSLPVLQDLVWKHFHRHGRHHLPWRQPDATGDFDPYKIMVSELMLQQTQVARVIPKYREFLEHFPTLPSLVQAPLAEVLRLWSGLGYNRRAKYLWQAAQVIDQKYGGKFPADLHTLITLPGIGPNTAGAILAYAFDQPAVFVETNIRTVFIHHIFDDKQTVTDQAILTLLEKSLDREHPREWYWALMDYGAYLKQTAGNAARRSHHYRPQSRFQGSRRQVRGQVIRLLSDGPHSLQELQQHIADSRLTGVLEELLSETLIRQDGPNYYL